MSKKIQLFEPKDNSPIGGEKKKEIDKNMQDDLEYYVFRESGVLEETIKLTTPIGNEFSE